MRKIASRVAFVKTSLMLLAMLPGGVQLWAQTPSHAGAGQDPFGPLHKALSSAVDNLLTAAAQRPPDMALPGAVSWRPEIPDVLNIPMRSGARDGSLQRVEQLRPLIEPILRQQGVPAELAAVVLVESGGQPAALSPKGARGIWQLMPDTARRYGLIVTRTRDDRTDLERSTRAAARYLRDLYGQFGSWSLALAAYNAGELLVESAISRTGTSNFDELSRQGRIPSETRNYVPAVWTAVGRLEDRSRPVNRMTSRTAEIVYAIAQN